MSTDKKYPSLKIDLSPAAVEARKQQLAADRELARLYWEAGDHEGTKEERESWIRGFVSGMRRSRIVPPPPQTP